MTYYAKKYPSYLRGQQGSIEGCPIGVKVRTDELDKGGRL
jgi:hypothetical protein